jgi:hypothetical protein
VTSTKQRARVAGRLYFLMALIGPIGLLVVPGQLVVPEDAAATAANIRASEWLLRLGIVSDLVHQIVAIFLVLALHRLFRDVDEALARLMLILGALVSVPIVFVNALNHVAALMLVSRADFLAVFEQPQRDALAYLFVHLHSQGIVVASVFWGLWLFPFGMLVMRSGFIPRVLGVLLLVAGAGYVVTSFTTLGLPRYAPLVTQVVSPLVIGELPIIFYLLIWGAREPGAAAAAAPQPGLDQPASRPR